MRHILLITSIIFAVVLVSCQSKTEEIFISNNLTNSVDIIYAMRPSALESIWHDYDGLTVGDNDPSTGCDICELNPGESDYIVKKLHGKSNVRIIARNSTTHVIEYIYEGTGADLKKNQWMVTVEY